MLTTDSGREADLFSLILNPDADVAASENARAAARRIHAFFLRERGWSHGQVMRHRFRDLAALCSPGEVRLCRVGSGADWSRRQDDFVLDLALQELRPLRGRGHAAAARRLTGGEQVKTVLKERTLALSEDDWAYLETLARTRGLKLERKTRETPALMGSALVALLEQSYGR